jgi:hypothetical protein
MKFRFNEAKATEAAACFKAPGRTDGVSEAYQTPDLGRPITTDHYVSMREGPVTSNVYNLIVSEPMSSQQSI